MIKNKRGRKPKHTLIINTNPVFDNLNEKEVILKLNIIKDTNLKNYEKEDNYINNNYEFLKSDENICDHCASNNCNMGYPINYINNYYIIKGYFCNIECATKYILNSDIYNKYELYSLINMYYNDMNNTKDSIIDISENKIFAKINNLNIFEKRIHENVKIIKNTKSDLKLFRKKNKKDIILDIMNIN